MFHRLINTVRLTMFGLLATGAWQTANAEIYTFDGAMVFCLASSCGLYESLGGPGNPTNLTPSDVSGFVEINVGPNGTFTQDDIVDYEFIITNANAAMTMVAFAPNPNPLCSPGGVPLPPGQICNANAANPLPLDNRVVTFGFDATFAMNFPGAIFGGSGTTGPNNELATGSLVATFTQPPFNALGAQVYFDLNPANAVPITGRLFGSPAGLIFTDIGGAFAQLPGAISVADNPTVFPNTAIGNNSVANVTVTNVGGGPLTISGVAMSNPLAAPFSIIDDGCGGTTLASQGSCVIELAFAPTLTGGLRSDSFSIVSNDPATPTVTVNVSGTALEPNIQVTPAPLNFVATTIGQTSQAVATVRNTGTGNLLIGTIDFSVLDSQFSPVLDNCSMQTLVPTGTCTVRLQFEPDTEGLSTSSFIIPSNDPDSASLNYTIRGTGVIDTIRALTVTPDELMFDEILAGEMSEQTILVESTGNDALTITSIALAGVDAIDFDQSNDCLGVLASGLSCTINVVFAPVTGGAKTAMVTILSDANDTPTVDVSITASAFDGPRIEVSPVQLDLGSPSAPIDVGSSTTADVTVTNTGTAPLTVGSLSINDGFRGNGVPSLEFMVVVNGCAEPIEPLSNCTLTVEFAPLTTEDKVAVLVIPSDDVSNPLVFVELIGYVFRGPRVDVPSTTIDVDGGTEVEVGDSASFDLVINNSGTEDLDISGFALGGVNANQFSLPAQTCVGVLIAPLGNCTVTILFTPTSQGEKTAELSIFSNDVTLVRAMTIVVALSATATPAPVIIIAPPGSQTVPPPPYALADEGGGSTGFGLLGIGLVLLIARRRYR